MKSLLRKMFSRVAVMLEHDAALPALTGISFVGGTMITFSTIDNPHAMISWFPPTGWFIAGIIVSALSLMGLVALAIVQAQLRRKHTESQQHLEERKAQLVLETKAAMAGYLTPVVNGAHRVATSVAETAATNMKERSLVALRNILDLRDVRLCLYLLETTERGNPISKNPKDRAVDTLEWDDDPPAGSTKPPRRQAFERGESPVDDANFVVLDQRRSRLISDWRKESQGDKAHEIDCDGASYGGFLVVPIVAGSTAKGVLTIDVPQAGLLNESHVAIAELAGRLLGVALHRLKVRSVNTNPTNPFPEQNPSAPIDPAEEEEDNASMRREHQ